MYTQVDRDRQTDMHTSTHTHTERNTQIGGGKIRFKDRVN